MVVIDKVCSGCGITYKSQDWRNIKYCSVKCRAKYLSNKGRFVKGFTYENKFGENAKNIKKQHSLSAKRTMHLRPNFTRKGVKISMETKKRMRESAIGKHCGSLHPNWKGGITSEELLQRTSMQYDEWRLKVFERDSFTCRWCGVKGSGLNAHHIKSFVGNKELRFDIYNGITLCVPCHVKTYRKEKEFEDFFYKILNGW